MEPEDTDSLIAPSAREQLYPGVTDEQWNDWRWQLQHRVSTPEALVAILPSLHERLEELRRILPFFRMGVTPYYLTLVNPADPADPILRQAVPRNEEYTYRDAGGDDPLAECVHSPVPGLTHRYPDRCLMVVSNTCAVYCRHCTRKRIMSEGQEHQVDVDRMVDYIRATPAIRDVIITGGDPFCFSTERLESIISRVRSVPHVDIVRIGTRTPVTLPQRITPDLCAMLEKYHPIWVNTHFNHPRECGPESARAVDRLLRAGIPVNNQTVLLRGVNDSVATMRDLIRALLRMRVRPYYIFQCDPVHGAEHLRTPISKGIEIIEGLRGHISGLGVPHYVIDAPGGGGKIPILPKYLLSYDTEEGRAVLRNYAGHTYEYRDPVEVGP